MATELEGTGSTSTASGSTRRATTSVAVVNPATEEVIAQVPQASVADVDRAVTAARRAFDDGPWPRMSPRERSDALAAVRHRRVADRRADLVDLIIAEAGCARPFAAGAPVRHAAAVRDLVRRARRELPVPRPAAARRPARAGSARA